MLSIKDSYHEAKLFGKKILFS